MPLIRSSLLHGLSIGWINIPKCKSSPDVQGKLRNSILGLEDIANNPSMWHRGGTVVLRFRADYPLTRIKCDSIIRYVLESSKSVLHKVSRLSVCQMRNPRRRKNRSDGGACCSMLTGDHENTIQKISVIQANGVENKKRDKLTVGTVVRLERSSQGNLS